MLFMEYLDFKDVVYEFAYHLWRVLHLPEEQQREQQQQQQQQRQPQAISQQRVLCYHHDIFLQKEIFQLDIQQH
jgi:hypothetical protein